MTTRKNYLLSIILMIPFILSALENENRQHGKANHFQQLPNACGITVNAGPDITICLGDAKMLNGIVTGSNQYSWEPPDGLSNPNILNPLANPSSTTVYTLTARAMSNNLISNGGFESGSINPASSGYTMYTTLPSFAGSSGGYMVMSVPQIASQFGCSPNIGAFAMAITPVGPGTNIWCQTIPVNPNTDYKVEYKVIGIPYIFGSPPSINLKVNGSFVGTVDAVSGLCIETSGSFIWNSGGATMGTFCLENSGGTGILSMCAIDDITIKECCVVSDEVEVEVYEIIADAITPPEISCDNRPITIDATTSTVGPGVTYQWTTRDGKIISGDKTLLPVVDTPGTYVLKVSGLHGCFKEVSVIVNGSVTQPDVSLKKTDIECLRPTGTIEASSKSKRPKYEWSGPNSFFSNKAIINSLTDPGEYIVIVTDDYGCQNSDTIELKDLRQDVDINIKGDTITCGKSDARFSGKSVAKKPVFSWTGPNNFRKDTQHITVVDTGWYFLTVKDSIGCSVTDSFYLLNLNNAIPVLTKSDTLTCSKFSIQLFLHADTSGTVVWKGPNNYTSTLKRPFVQDSGLYIVEIITPNGCVGRDSVYIYQFSAIPDIQINAADTLNCNKTSILLSGTSQTIGSTFQWTKGPIILGSLLDIVVLDSGLYRFTVIGTNGCEVFKEIYVHKDIDSPIINSIDDTLNCDKPNILLNVNFINNAQYQWRGPNNFSSFLPRPSVMIAGLYTLTVTGQNGCSAEKIIEIYEDIVKPFFNLNSDTISCSKRFVSLFHNAPFSIRNFDWVGPNGFTSMLRNPIFFSGGNYSLTVTDKNGCTHQQSVTIIQDTLQPNFTLEADTIQCKNTASIRGLNLQPSYQLQWIGPNGFNSTSPINTVTSSGYYTLKVTGPNGCVREDSIFVFQKDTIPDIFAREDTITCFKPTLKLQGGSGTTNAQFSWTGPNGFTSNVANPEIQDSGLYILTVIDPSGCEVSKAIQISKLTTPANVSVQSSSLILDCKDSLVIIQANANEPAFSIKWSGPSDFQSFNSNITVNIPGSYYIEWVNIHGCISQDSIQIVDNRNLPTISLLPGTLSCLKPSATLNIKTIDKDLQFQWMGPNGFMSTDSTPVILISGIYTLTVLNSSNCTLTQTVMISADTIRPDLFLSADTINCMRDTIPVLANSTFQGFTMDWTGPNGFQHKAPRFQTSVPGIYTCVITNPRNGCFTEKSIEVIEDTRKIQNADIRFKDAACNQNTGEIIIDQVTGGAGSYTYSYNGGLTYSNTNSLGNLAPGMYSVIIRDQNLCEYNRTITIGSVGDVVISPLSSLLLDVNEQIQLQLYYNRNDADIKTILWEPSDQLSCNHCTDPILKATHDDRIIVWVEDINGCMDSISFSVRIRQKTNIYFPNIFSPNGDGINDYFYPAGNLQANLQLLRIFNRWGELVYESTALPLNNEQLGWNGMYKLKRLNPDVFVYYAEYEENGEQKIIHGNFQLIR